MPLYIPRQFSTNPRETFCPICRGSTDEVLMMGATHKLVCVHCGMLHLGAPEGEICIKCGCNRLRDEGESLPEEKFVASRACRPCTDAIRKARAVIELGGRGVQCSDCGAIGAFAKETPKVAEYRSRFADQPEKVWQLDHHDCPECRKKNEQAKLPKPVQASETGPGRAEDPSPPVEDAARQPGNSDGTPGGSAHGGGPSGEALQPHPKDRDGSGNVEETGGGGGRGRRR